MRPRTSPSRRPGGAPPPLSHTAAARRCLVALGFIASFIAIGIEAASTASGSPVVLLSLEACCLLPVVIFVILELWPALVALRGGASGAAQRRTIRCFRSQLDALPENPHPMDA